MYADDWLLWLNFASLQNRNTLSRSLFRKRNLNIKCSNLRPSSCKHLLTWFWITWEAVLYLSRISLPGSPANRAQKYLSNQHAATLSAIQQIEKGRPCVRDSHMSGVLGRDKPRQASPVNTEKLLQTCDSVRQDLSHHCSRSSYATDRKMWGGVGSQPIPTISAHLDPVKHTGSWFSFITNMERPFSLIFLKLVVLNKFYPLEAGRLTETPRTKFDGSHFPTNKILKESIYKGKEVKQLFQCLEKFT
jgi:hypothetical protein